MLGNYAFNNFFQEFSISKTIIVKGGKNVNSKLVLMICLELFFEYLTIIVLTTKRVVIKKIIRIQLQVKPKVKQLSLLVVLRNSFFLLKREF